MKYSIPILLFTLLFINSKNLIGQDTSSSKYSLQLILGLAKTFHHNQPVNFSRCIEGCIPDEQKSRIAPNINLSLYRAITQKSSLKLGFGTSSYKYWEKGRGSDGSTSFYPYEFTNKLSFYGLSLGYRYIFNQQKKVKLFIENEFIYETPVNSEYNYAIKNGLAIQPKIGAIMNLNTNWSIVSEAFYKSALISYGDKDFGEDYRPYAYGIQLGVNLKI